MSDFEKCCQDLNRWDIYYETGFFYKNDIEVEKWLRIGGEDGQTLVFTLEGEITGLGGYII